MSARVARNLIGSVMGNANIDGIKFSDKLLKHVPYIVDAGSDRISANRTFLQVKSLKETNKIVFNELKTDIDICIKQYNDNLNKYDVVSYNRDSDMHDYMVKYNNEQNGDRHKNIFISCLLTSSYTLLCITEKPYIYFSPVLAYMLYHYSRSYSKDEIDIMATKLSETKWCIKGRRSAYSDIDKLLNE